MWLRTSVPSLWSWITTCYIIYLFVVNKQILGPFEKFVDSPYYSESELCGGAVTVSFSKYLPWQAMHFLQRSTHFSKTCCRPFAASFRRIVEQAVLSPWTFQTAVVCWFHSLIVTTHGLHMPSFSLLYGSFSSHSFYCRLLHTFPVRFTRLIAIYTRTICCS
jgi:hypothetical protein